MHGRLFMRGAWVACIALSLLACKPGDDTQPVQAPESTTTVPADVERAQYEFVATIDGVWATRDEHRADKDQTVFRLGHMVDTAMFVNRNGVGMDVVTDHVDLANQSITFEFRESPTKEKMTFRVLPDGSGLRVTYADGTTETLTYLRDWNDLDTALVQSAEEKTMLDSALGGAAMAAVPAKGWASTVDCNAATEFRARSVCKNEDLLRMDRAMAARFDTLAGQGEDVAGTRAAAIRQLDACNDSQCLRKAYAEWAKYLEENYATAQ